MCGVIISDGVTNYFPVLKRALDASGPCRTAVCGFFSYKFLCLFLLS